MPGFIPKQYKKDAVTIRLDSEKIRQIDLLAQRFGLSRNEFINQCIDFALRNMGSRLYQEAQEVEL